MNRFVRWSAAVAALLAVCGTTAADLLVSRSNHETFLVAPGQDPSVSVLFLATPDAYDDFSRPLFAATFAPADAGKTLHAGPGSPHFAINAGVLTDGNNDRIFLGYAPPGTPAAGHSATGFFESEFFYGTAHFPFDTGPLDLKGATVDRATFTVTDFSKSGTYFDWLNGVSYEVYDFAYRVDFEGAGSIPSGSIPSGAPGGAPGAAPEPAGFVLGCIGVAALLGAGLRRQHGARALPLVAPPLAYLRP